MATSVSKITLSASRNIPFNKLVLSQSNVRRVKAGISIEQLAEDIARRTLLQSLNVRPVLNAEGAESGMFEVPAGGRRFRALELLVKQKRMTKTQPVPCVVRLDGIAEEDSLAENVQREALHPLDQFRAFATLAEKGQGIEDIAASFSVTPAVVRQRLKLASVNPKLLARYEEDALTLDLLMAFALNADHEQQEQVWDAIQQRSWLQTPHHIRRLLTENTISARDASVRFVGIEAYEAAGGFVMRDLFEEDGGGYLTDPLLLQKLVNEKLDAAAETVRAEGWKWVEAAEDIPYNATYGLRPLVPVAPALTDEEEHELETLLNERDELEASEGDAETEKRLAAVTQRIAELEAKTPTFAPEDLDRAGCFLSLDADGRLCIERGYVRPEDEPRSSEDAEAAEPAKALPVVSRRRIGDRSLLPLRWRIATTTPQPSLRS